MIFTSRELTVGLTLGILLTWNANNAIAQCSRGGSSRSTVSPGLQSVSPSSFASQATVSPQFSYGNSSILTVGNQAYQAQQQMIALGQLYSRQQAQLRYNRDQELLATRRQRADANREKRAERIAANIARRDAREGAGDNDRSGSMLARTTALNEASPFE